MFGADMMSKLAEMKKLAEESKEKLNSITISGDSGGGLVVVTMNGNRKLTSVKINAELTLVEPEHLEDLLCVAMNRALEKVNSLNESEVLSASKNLFSEM